MYKFRTLKRFLEFSKRLINDCTEIHVLHINEDDNSQYYKLVKISFERSTGRIIMVIDDDE